jgi:hypothetical protein
VYQRVAREVGDRLDRPQAVEQRRAAHWEDPFVEQSLGADPGPGAGAIHDRDVKIVAAEIEGRTACAESHLDLRVPTRELRHPRQQPALQELVRHAQVEQPAHTLAADAIDRATQLVEPAPHAGQELSAVLR